MTSDKKILLTSSKITLFIIVFLLSFFVIFIFQLRTISYFHIRNSREYFENNYEYWGNCYVDAETFLEKKAKEIDKEDCGLAVENVLSILPSRIRVFIEDIWAIVFTSKLPQFAQQYTSNVELSISSAVTVPHIKTIFVFETNVDKIPFIILHEFCHAIADEYGSVDYDNEFVVLYELYKSSYKESSPYAVPGYAVSSQFEFFAATMSDFLVNPDYLFSLAPEVAEYMDELLETVPYDGLVEDLIVDVKEFARKL